MEKDALVMMGNDAIWHALYGTQEIEDFLKKDLKMMMVCCGVGVGCDL